MKIEMTEKIARAAATDEANRQMQKDGRTKWSKKDYALACKTFEKLCKALGWRKRRKRRRR